MSDYYDRQGNPIEDVLEWARLYESEDRTIGYEERDGVRVSTVWLGLNHNYLPGGPPLIFETMVFGGEFDQHQDRYSTEAQAIAGHDQWVAKVFGTR